MAEKQPVFDAPLGRPPVLEWIAPQELQVDEAYQRSLESETSQTLIRRIAARWDWGLCQPVAVARRAEGALFIVDGQHRRAAALLRGDIGHLPCVVQNFADKGAEAAAFVALNRQRRPLDAVAVFKASLAAGDAQAREVMNLLNAAGLSLAPHQNCISWKPGMLYCVPTISGGHKRFGKRPVAAALSAIKGAYPNQVLQYAGQLLEGLIAFAATVSPPTVPSADALTALLRKHGQGEWVRRAHARMAADGDRRKEAMRAVLASAWCGPVVSAPPPPPSPVPRSPVSAPVDRMPPPGNVRGGSSSYAVNPIRDGTVHWCDQCDRKVSGSQVQTCTSPFCSVKRTHGLLEGGD